MIESLPETDIPKFFGLPPNIDRSSQIVISNQVIGQLKILKRSNIKLGGKFDKDTVKSQFKPIWKLWEALKKVKRTFLLFYHLRKKFKYFLQNTEYNWW